MCIMLNICLDRAVRALLDAEADVIKWYTSWCEYWPYNICLSSECAPLSMSTLTSDVIIWYTYDQNRVTLSLTERCAPLDAEADVIKWYTYDVNVDLILDRAVRALLDAEADVIKWYTYDVNVDLILDRAVRALLDAEACYKMIHIWWMLNPWQSGRAFTSYADQML